MGYRRPSRRMWEKGQSLELNGGKVNTDLDRRQTDIPDEGIVACLTCEYLLSGCVRSLGKVGEQIYGYCDHDLTTTLTPFILFLIIPTE